MNHTVRTILSILLIMIGAAYLITYLRKKKNGTHKDITYKLIFIVAFMIITIPLFFTFK